MKESLAVRDDDALDEVRALGWAQGFNDGVQGKPRLPRPEQIFVDLADMEVQDAFKRSYNEGHDEARTRTADLALLHEVEAALDSIEMSRDAD